MNLKKFFNTEEGGCIIFYIVLFVTLPSLFANFLQCSSSKSEKNCRDTIAMQRDSIRYLEALCHIDTATVNDMIWGTAYDIADMGATALRIKGHVMEMEEAEGESDITLELNTLCKSLNRRAINALTRIDTLAITMKNDSATHTLHKKVLNINY